MDFGYLVYKFKKIMGVPDLSDQFRNKLIRHKDIGYNVYATRQSACFVINTITVDNFAVLFNCMPVDWGVRLYDVPDGLFNLVDWDRSSFVCYLVHRDTTDDLLLHQISSGVVCQSRDLHLSRNTLWLLSNRHCFLTVLKRDLFVYRDDSLTI